MFFFYCISILLDIFISFLSPNFWVTLYFFANLWWFYPQYLGFHHSFIILFFFHWINTLICHFVSDLKIDPFYLLNSTIQFWWDTLGWVWNFFEYQGFYNHDNSAIFLWPKWDIFGYNPRWFWLGNHGFLKPRILLGFQLEVKNYSIPYPRLTIVDWSMLNQLLIRIQYFLF